MVSKWAQDKKYFFQNIFNLLVVAINDLVYLLILTYIFFLEQLLCRK